MQQPSLIFLTRLIQGALTSIVTISHRLEVLNAFRNIIFNTGQYQVSLARGTHTVNLFVCL